MYSSSGRKESTNPNFRYGYLLVGGGLPCGGQKAQYVLRNPGKPNFWAGYPGIFAGISRGCPKSLREKKVCVYFLAPNSGKKKAHKLKKILGTAAGCPRNSRRDKPGVYRPVSQGFPVVCHGETHIFAGTPAGCPRDTRPPRVFSENLCHCDFLPSHRRPVILKPVGRIFKISDSNPIQGKCRRPSHPSKTRVWGDSAERNRGRRGKW